MPLRHTLLLKCAKIGIPTLFINRLAVNILDVIILVCLIPALVQGFRKGFIKQAFSIAAIVLGAWLSFTFSSKVAVWAGPFVKMNGTLLGILSFVLVFAAVCLALMIASNLARKLVSFVMLGWMDKLLGTVFGLLKAVLAIGLAIMLVDAANTVLDLIPESTIKESILYAPVKDIANVVYPYLKELIFKK